MVDMNVWMGLGFSERTSLGFFAQMMLLFRVGSTVYDINDTYSFLSFHHSSPFPSHCHVSAIYYLRTQPSPHIHPHSFFQPIPTADSTAVPSRPRPPPKRKLLHQMHRLHRLIRSTLVPRPSSTLANSLTTRDIRKRVHQPQPIRTHHEGRPALDTVLPLLPWERSVANPGVIVGRGVVKDFDDVGVVYFPHFLLFLLLRVYTSP